MNRLMEHIKKHRELALGILDVLIIFFAYLAAFLIRIEFRIDLYQTDYLPKLFLMMPLVIFIDMLAIGAFHLDRSLWNYTSVTEAIRVAMAVAIGNMSWFLIVILFKVTAYIRSVPIIAAMLQLLSMLGLRIIYRYIREGSRKKTASHKALIIGAGSAGAAAVRIIERETDYSTRIVGFIDHNPDKVKKRLNGLTVLGTNKDLADIVDRYEVDTAYIAIRSITKHDLQELIEQCRKLNLRTRIVTMEYRAEVEKTSVRNVQIDDLLGRGELHLNNDEIGGYIKGRVILVTGAGGSIGSELVRQILNYDPKKLVLIDIYENTMYDLQQEINIAKRSGNLKTDAEIVCLIGSVRDRRRIDRIFQDHMPDVVFHAAAHKHVPLVEDSPLEAIKNNVFGTYNVVRACIQNEVGKFVLISTDKAVRTTNVMGASKRMCELIVEGYRNNGVTKLCAVRFGNVLGSHGSVIPLFEKQIESGGPVTVTDPEITRYFMTIPETAQLVLQAGAYAEAGEIYVLDMGTPVKIADLAKNLIELSGYKPGVDIQIEYTGLRPGEKLYEELLVDTSNCRKTDNDLIYVAPPEDITKKQVDDRIRAFRDMIRNDESTNRSIIDTTTIPVIKDED